MEQVFGWQAGSIDRILAGGDPIMIRPESSAAPPPTASDPSAVDPSKIEVVLLRMPSDATPAQREYYQQLAEIVSQKLVDRVHRHGALSPRLGLSELTREAHRMI